MARRRYPKIDVCKLHPERFRDMSSAQLWNVWKRLGASAPARGPIARIKGLVSNLATAKDGYRYRGKSRLGHNYEGYQMIATKLEREIWDMQAKAGCKISDNELVARDMDRSERPDVARRLRKKAIIK